MCTITLFILCLVLLVVTVNVRLESEIVSEGKARARETLFTAFAVDENNLRKLNEIVHTRMEQAIEKLQLRYVKAQFTYSVTFLESTSYEVADFEKILSEGNTDKKKITRVAIEGNVVMAPRPEKEDEPVEYRRERDALYGRVRPGISVEISSKWISYEVVGVDKDWVQLAQQDILERFDLIKHNYRRFKWMAPLAGVLVSFLLFVVLVARYVQQHKGVSEGTFSLLVFLALGGCVVVGFLTYLTVEYLYPDYFFVLGEQKSKYETITSIKSKLIWVAVSSILVYVVVYVVKNILQVVRTKP